MWWRHMINSDVILKSIMEDSAFTLTREEILPYIKIEC